MSLRRILSTVSAILLLGGMAPGWSDCSQCATAGLNSCGMSNGMTWCRYDNGRIILHKAPVHMIP